MTCIISKHSVIPSSSLRGYAIEKKTIFIKIKYFAMYVYHTNIKKNMVGKFNLDCNLVASLLASRCEDRRRGWVVSPPLTPFS